VVAAVAVAIDPSADGIAGVGRLHVLRPVAPVRIDAAEFAEMIAAHVGGLGGDDDLDRLVGEPQARAGRKQGKRPADGGLRRPRTGSPCWLPRSPGIPASAAAAGAVPRACWDPTVPGRCRASTGLSSPDIWLRHGRARRALPASTPPAKLRSGSPIDRAWACLRACYRITERAPPACRRGSGYAG